MCLAITVVAQSLLQESEEHRDDDAGLQCLAKTDEEDLGAISLQAVTEYDLEWNPPGTAKTSDAATMVIIAIQSTL